MATLSVSETLNKIASIGSGVLQSKDRAAALTLLQASCKESVQPINSQISNSGAKPASSFGGVLTEVAALVGLATSFEEYLRERAKDAKPSQLEVYGRVDDWAKVLALKSLFLELSRADTLTPQVRMKVGVLLFGLREAMGRMLSGIANSTEGLTPFAAVSDAFYGGVRRLEEQGFSAEVSSFVKQL